MDNRNDQQETKEMSLQNRFLEFRKQKMQAAKFNSRNRVRTQEEKDQLRLHFLQKVNEYLGLPYKQKYHQEDSPYFDSPLFLDCCGLIRKVLLDLQQEFGFRIAHWNQAYQFDTLPIRYESHTQLTPGDLIFVSGRYFNPKIKAQIHDMVHVEVFIGGKTGEQTIGARLQKGVVQVFDSYRFSSSNYGDMKYHFCSIETWLDGVCKRFVIITSSIRLCSSPSNEANGQSMIMTT
eukprot:TRINITY_DN8472_c0_g1_i2.p1 TRINITY_DN8472_c0_g1~~TRINITY_DN8472_c0_g1_i2.p1  ORF type:complete len:234 (+),score=42.42 TRINITY_DN8472_c0_g1_i2:55-756(+)